MSESTEQLDQANVPDLMNMSDDELSRFDISQYLDDQNIEGSEETDNANPDQEAESEETEEGTTQEDTESEAQETETESANKTEQVTDTDPSTTQSEQNTESNGQKPDAKTDPSSQDVPDYKAFYEAILNQPIKANGKEISLSKPEDVISLIQMGANYHQKMAAIKPSRRITKMLESADLMDESKIGFLIDLHNKNPQAIAKLMKDSEIDFMDFDVEQGAGYKSEHQAPSEESITLEDTILELRSSPGFVDMFKTITTNWDTGSQDTLAKNPGLLRILDAQKASGNFDIVMAELARERMLGRLDGIPDLQAYGQLEAQLNEQGKLKVSGLNKPAPTPTKPVKKEVNKEVANAKKAAAAPRQTVQGKKTTEVENLFSLSDEEFAKIDPTLLK